jgi:hypothetical protein
MIELQEARLTLERNLGQFKSQHQDCPAKMRFLAQEAE